MDVAEMVKSKVSSLPRDKQHEVLDFVEFLSARTRAGSAPGAPEERSFHELAGDLIIDDPELPEDLSSNKAHLDDLGRR